MNIAMEQTEVCFLAVDCRRLFRHKCRAAFQRYLCLLQEYVNGQLKNKYGNAFIRGNNGAPAAATCLCRISSFESCKPDA